MGVATGAHKNAEKLSDSLFNDPLWVNNRVRLGAQFDISNSRPMG